VPQTWMRRHPLPFFRTFASRSSSWIGRATLNAGTGVTTASRSAAAAAAAAATWRHLRTGGGANAETFVSRASGTSSEPYAGPWRVVSRPAFEDHRTHAVVLAPLPRVLTTQPTPPWQ